MRIVFVLLSIASAGCLKSTNFHCDLDADCGTGGVCEVSYGGFCSFIDSSCTVTGRKFGDNSGPSSNQCVGETGGENPGGEPNGGEAGMEPLPMGCPGTYNPLPNSGPRGHKYLVLATPTTWSAQRDLCAGMGTFLAYPDGANVTDARLELAAIDTAAGPGAWAGVSDLAVEGVYRTSLNNPVSAITQMLVNQGGGAGGKDCLATTQINMPDEDCAGSRKAVCECIP